MATQAQLVTAIKSLPLTNNHPWNLLKPVLPYDATQHQYGLRGNTRPATVRLYAAILEAAALYGIDEPTVPTFAKLPFRMIKKQIGNDREIFVEAGLPDDTHLLVASRQDRVRVSIIETDDTRSPSRSFKDLDSNELTMVVLSLIPHILGVDNNQGNGRIQQAIQDLGLAIDGMAAAPWATEIDVPDIAKEAAYFLDAALCVIKDTLTLDCGESTTDLPKEVENFDANGTIHGRLLKENLSSGWMPKVLVADGQASLFSNARVNVKEAKAQFSGYMAHRKWTLQEQMMIPQFPDNMPVMPEVMRIANRIVNTTGDLNPICNIMWRGVTGYGKSTGIAQLACILNIPMLTITCHPNMEAQDFKSQFVPEAKTDGIPLNMENVLMAPENGEQEASQNSNSFFDAAMAHLQGLSEGERADVLNAKAFFSLAMMDTDAAAEMLMGKAEQIDTEDLCSLYSDICLAIKTMPLKQKIAELKLTQPQEESNADNNKPDFVHVISPYLKAMANGYLCEIQEASRIRDSGVLVSLNEFNRPGAIMRLMDGGFARRHKDALAIITDNVGYASCRPIDPSVIRRQDFIIDSYELTEDMLKDRAKRNTGVTDASILDLGYKLWNCVKEYCEQNSITEGSVSPVEYERFIQAVKYEGLESVSTILDECIISKATSSIEDQKDIRTACQTVYAA